MRKSIKNENIRNRISKKITAGVLAGIMVVGSLTGCGSDNTSSDNTSSTSNSSSSGDSSADVKEQKYSIWIGKGEDSQYYSDYADNPILSTYYNSQTYTGEDGNEVSVTLDFQIPATGTERDNLMTLIGTGDYTDVIDVDYYSGTITDLYEEGIALDITEYVEAYMPNYKAFLEANPDLALTATNLVDGENKYLCIRGYTTYEEQWQGFAYRRDWIVKYGTNPVTGAAFSGAYTDPDDTTSWGDDVVFPSGGSDPVYISDLEWMFEIFTTAMEKEGITDGYCISIPYFGYSTSGFLNAAFGGGTAAWYKTPEGTIEFGGDSDNFRAYLECMNKWYENGWLDKAFAEHVGDMPWRIDEVNVRQGKVGMWVGMDSQLMNKMNTGEDSTKDIIVYAASYPINDIYGDESAKNVEPYSLFSTSQEGKTFVVTDKAKGKDLVALFTFIDSTYVDENAVKNGYGYSKEEYEEFEPEFYTRAGLTEGTYYDSGTTTEDGKKLYYFVDLIDTDGGSLKAAAAFGRVFGLMNDSSTVAVRYKRTEQLQQQYDLWNEVYKNTGYLSSSFKSQLSAADAKEFSAIETNVDEFMSKNVVNFINGSKDVYSDDDWNAYVNALAKYNPTRNTEIYQNLLDSLK